MPGAVSRSILRFSLRLVRCLCGSLREHDCAISTIDPRSFTLRTSISTTPGLKFTSGTWLRNTSVFSNFSQRDYRYSTNTKFTVRRTNTYTHTYIHTYIQTPLAFNTLMWGSLRLAPIMHHTTPSRSPHNALHSPSIYIYIWYVRIPYIYTSCLICARCNISTLQVGSCNHCCSRDKTSRTERLNSVNQRNRNLKTVRKGGTTTKMEADY